jgi:hypothetical protein
VTEATFTMGRWRAVKHTYWHVEGPFGEICSFEDYAEDEQDAHLTAASPDLFAAAILAVSEADASIGSLPLTARDRAKDDGDGFAFNISGSTIKLLRDAIAKARGEQ